MSPIPAELISPHLPPCLTWFLKYVGCMKSSKFQKNTSRHQGSHSRALSESAVDFHERPRRDYLIKSELSRLLAAAKLSRNGLRDYAMLLIGYRHGFRVSELLDTRKTDIDWHARTIWVARLKGGLSTEQPMAEDEIAALSGYLSLLRDNTEWLFISERGRRLSRQAGYYIVRSAACRAGLAKVNPHQLRHTCGFLLANAGNDVRLIQDYLGHRDPRHTARYTRTAAERFQHLW
jgi:type 1 fimbriae regulatory protein FimB/type 1 fimbriae regulatory protein FimE